MAGPCDSGQFGKRGRGLRIIDPHDLGAFKLMAGRSDGKDARWIAQALSCGALDQDTLLARLVASPKLRAAAVKQNVATKLRQVELMLHGDDQQLLPSFQTLIQ